jgi:hypothetical protein
MTNCIRTITLRSLALAAALFVAGQATGAVAADSFSDDRSKIEQLEARYLFAMDFRDPDAYAETFAENGVLTWAGGVVKGREAIREFMKEQHSSAGFGDTKQAPGAYPPAARHFLTNLVVKVNGDHATSVAYWFELGDNNPQRKPELGAYGHFENTLIKENGEWYYLTRTIFNEQLAARHATGPNPAH